MKFYTKIFLATLSVVILALSLTEYLLISSNLTNALQREVENALSEYNTIESRLRSGLSETKGSGSWNKRTLAGVSAQIQSQEKAGFFVVCEEELGYSNLLEEYDPSFLLLQTEEDRLAYRLEKDSANGQRILVCGSFSVDGQSLQLLTVHSVADVFFEIEQQEKLCSRLFLLLSFISAALIYWLSVFLTRPIKRLTMAAQHMAAGHYEERVPEQSQDEIGELGRQFNGMAEAIEEKIEDLKQQAQQKEEFVNSFAHELKTPLTSMIGYADLLYQGKLQGEQQKEAHRYILNEGLRLEALSHKMMELALLDQQEFLLEQVEIQEFLTQLLEGFSFWFEEHQIRWHLQIDSSWLALEQDLVPSLFLNLFDNAAKAGTRDIWITGKRKDAEYYLLCVRDQGCGMPKEELSRITEAFYMVDKTRSRKMHGAGLGLALVQKIVQLHHGRLSFESEPGKGTCVMLELPLVCVDDRREEIEE